MTIYLDVILFENILMNILIIYTSNYLNKHKTNVFRMFVSSIIGAVYYVALLLPQTSFLNFYIFKVILSIIMVLIAFGFLDIYNFLKSLVIFYFTSFIYGGLAYGVYNIFFSKYTNDYYSIKIIIMVSIIGSILIKKSITVIKNNICYSKYDYDIDICIDDKIKRLKGFLDTGNNIRDPITNKPVLIVSFNSIKNILPNEIVSIVKSNLYNFENILNNNKRIRLLSYISVGNQNGLMLGYKIDKINIYINKEEKNVIKDVVIGINNTKLSSNTKFDALLSIDLLNYKGGNINGKVTI